MFCLHECGGAEKRNDVNNTLHTLLLLDALRLNFAGTPLLRSNQHDEYWIYNMFFADKLKSSSKITLQEASSHEENWL